MFGRDDDDNNNDNLFSGIANPVSNLNPFDWRNFSIFRPFSPLNHANSQALHNLKSCGEQLSVVEKDVMEKCRTDKDSSQCKDAFNQLNQLRLQCKK